MILPALVLVSFQEPIPWAESRIDEQIGRLVEQKRWEEVFRRWHRRDARTEAGRLHRLHLMHALSRLPSEAYDWYERQCGEDGFIRLRCELESGDDASLEEALDEYFFVRASVAASMTLATRRQERGDLRGAADVLDPLLRFHPSADRPLTAARLLHVLSMLGDGDRFAAVATMVRDRGISGPVIVGHAGPIELEALIGAMRVSPKALGGSALGDYFALAERIVEGEGAIDLKLALNDYLDALGSDANPKSAAAAREMMKQPFERALIICRSRECGRTDGAVILCTGDLTTTDDLRRSIVFVRGDLTVEGELEDSIVYVGGTLRVSEEAEDCTIHAAKPVDGVSFSKRCVYVNLPEGSRVPGRNVTRIERDALKRE